MKKLFNYLSFAFIFLAAISCTINGSEGPPGPQGPQGPVGPQGPAQEPFEAIAYEYVDITFSGANEYSVILEFPETDWDLILPTDVVLMYQLVGNDNGTDIWEPLPRTLFYDGGTFIYTYDFTEFDARVFLDANFNLGILPGDYTDLQIFRVVIVPADLTSRTTNTVDYSSYEEVMQYYGLNEEDIIRVN